jgi:predicted nucleic acid-binding protein
MIYTSMVTLTEVTKKRRGPLAVEKKLEQRIEEFFKNDYIKLIPLDYVVGTRARRLIWDFPFLPVRDAIHIASAVQVPVDVIEHYDEADFGKAGKRIAEQKLPGFPTFRNPKWAGQPDLPGTKDSSERTGTTQIEEFDEPDEPPK